VGFLCWRGDPAGAERRLAPRRVAYNRECVIAGSERISRMKHSKDSDYRNVFIVKQQCYGRIDVLPCRMNPNISGRDSLSPGTVQLKSTPYATLFSNDSETPMMALSCMEMRTETGVYTKRAHGTGVHSDLGLTISNGSQIVNSGLRHKMRKPGFRLLLPSSNKWARSGPYETGSIWPSNEFFSNGGWKPSTQPRCCSA
jgi:hypothetical protein